MSNKTINPTDSCPNGSPWSTSDAAKFLKVSHRHLIRLITANKVQSIRLGRRVFISDTELRRVASEGIN